ncbi:DUF1294 domain-containing protein [Seohaeicola nanhaiensis]|uniref:DUF1294 domain-containing protein n=1 Tax=Seohaeicola nanhaiensis TaxID=1387282 RepID=A0ABV9KMC9_9RHOB
MTIAIPIWLIFINTVAWLAFRADKRRAMAGEWRIPETRLLTLALAGGWFGAKLAQRRFRHKTRKQPFAAFLNFVPITWVTILWLMLMVPATFQALRATPGVLATAVTSLVVHRQTAEPVTQPARRFFQKARQP